MLQVFGITSRYVFISDKDKLTVNLTRAQDLFFVLGNFSTWVVQTPGIPERCIFWKLASACGRACATFKKFIKDLNGKGDIIVAKNFDDAVFRSTFVDKKDLLWQSKLGRSDKYPKIKATKPECRRALDWLVDAGPSFSGIDPRGEHGPPPRGG